RTIRVVGPSRELLPHLVLMGSVAEMQRGPSVRIDADGRAVIRGNDPARLHWSVGNCCGWTRLQARSGDGPELELEPAQAPAGTRRSGEDGTALPFALGFEPDGPTLAYIRGSATMQVIDAAARARITTVLAWTKTLGSLRFPAGAVVWHGDMGELNARSAERR